MGWLAWLTAEEELPEACDVVDRFRKSPPRRGFLRWVIAPELLPGPPRIGDRGPGPAGVLRWLMQPEKLPSSGEVSRKGEGKGGD